MPRKKTVALSYHKLTTITQAVICNEWCYRYLDEGCPGNDYKNNGEMYVNEWGRCSDSYASSRPGCFEPGSAHSYRVYHQLDNCAGVFYFWRNLSLSTFLILLFRKANSVLL